MNSRKCTADRSKNVTPEPFCRGATSKPLSPLRFALEFPVGGVVKPLYTIVSENEIVFDAYTANSFDINARLICDDRAQIKRIMFVVVWIMGDQSKLCPKPCVKYCP